MKQNTTRHVLIKGNGGNQHTLYGSFAIEDKHGDFADITVRQNSVLKHETPSGSYSGEHQALNVDRGEWVMGKQVEFNPFNREITQIWD